MKEDGEALGGLNPYESPREPLEPLIARASGDPFRRRWGFVHHVRIVAVLMIIQGALETLAGLGLVAFAVLMPRLMTGAAAPEDAPEEQFVWIIALVYGGMGIAALVAAVLHLAAGLRNYRFRGRTMGIVALAGGMLTLFTCYCLPTAVGLGVYGLIVYLDTEVSEAFRMGEAGCRPRDILTAFRR